MMSGGALRVKLTDGQLRALSALAGPATALSPFAVLREGPLDPLPASLLGADGSLSADWGRIAGLLARTDRYGAVRYRGPEGAVDTAVYSVTATGESAMVRLRADASEIQSPPGLAALMVLMREVFGGGLSGPGELRIDLPIDAARVFCAVIDAVRRHTHRVLAGDAVSRGPIAERAEVVAIAQGKVQSTDLSWVFSHYVEDGAISEAAVDSGLRALAAARLLTDSGGRVRLGGSAAELVGALLVIGGHLRLRAATTGPNGSDQLVDVSVLTGLGPGGLLWSAVDGVVTMETATGVVILELIQRFLTGPELVIAGAASGIADTRSSAPPPPPATVPRIESSTAPACSQCGRAFESDEAFCRSCGARRQAGAATAPPCPSCGNALDADAAFCRKCGTKRPWGPGEAR